MKRDGVIGIKMASSIPNDPISFLLQHVLGIDELKQDTKVPLTELRQQNLQKVKYNPHDTFVGRLVSSLGFPHTLIPSGSMFENLMLPHINNLLFSKEDGETLQDSDGFISDIDIMCAFSALKVYEENHLESSPGTFESQTPNTEDGTHPTQTDESLALLALCHTNYPRFYKLKAVGNPEQYNLPWSKMFSKDSESVDMHLCGKRFSKYFHELGIQYFMDNPHPFHDKTPPEMHGPSLCIPVGSKSELQKDAPFRTLLSEDIVWSLNCDWPSDALNWTKRQRKTNWLSPQVIQEMIDGKCNLVPSTPPVEHLPDKHQYWRLSFSRAEVKLAEQIPWIARKCYMILKGLHYTHFSKPKGISTYHLKTALFWLLDEEPASSFTNENLSACFMKLVNKVLSFLRDRNYPNYFIPANNMVSHIDDEKIKELENKILFVSENLPTCLEQCHTVLVSTESFTETYSTVLDAIKSGETQKSKLASAYIDSLLCIGNFYLITVDTVASMPYFEQAFGYASEAIKDNPESVSDVYGELLKMLCDHSVEVGDIDRAIHYMELNIERFIHLDVIAIDETFSALLANLGCLFHMKQANQKKPEASKSSSPSPNPSTELHVKAEESFVKSISCPIVSPLSHIEYANFLYCGGKYSAALTQLQAGLKGLQTDEGNNQVLESDGERFFEHSAMYIGMGDDDDDDVVDVSNAVTYKECQQVINYGDIEKYTVDETIRDTIEESEMFHTPANIYCRYLISRCFQRLDQTADAIQETSNIYSALRDALDVYGKSYMIQGFEMCIKLCRELGSLDVLKQIEALKLSAESSAESSSDDDLPHGVMLPTVLPAASSDEKPFGSLSQVLQSHMVVNRSEVLPTKRKDV